MLGKVINHRIKFFQDLITITLYTEYVNKTWQNYFDKSSVILRFLKMASHYQIFKECWGGGVCSWQFNWIKIAPIVLTRSFRSNCLTLWPMVGPNFSVTMKNYFGYHTTTHHSWLIVIRLTQFVPMADFTSDFSSNPTQMSRNVVPATSIDFISKQSLKIETQTKQSKLSTSEAVRSCFRDEPIKIERVI